MVSRGFSEPSPGGVGGSGSRSRSRSSSSSNSSSTAGLGYGPSLAWVLLACSACIAGWSARARSSAATAAMGDFRAEPAIGTSQDRVASLAVHVAELRDQVTKVEEAWGHALANSRLEGGVPLRQASASASASSSATASDAPAASPLRHGLARLSADKMDIEGLEEVLQRERGTGVEQCGWFVTSHCTPYGFVERSLCGASAPPSASLAGFCVCPASAGGGGDGGDGDGVEYWGRSCVEQGGAQQPGKSAEARCEVVCSLGTDGTALLRTGGLGKEAHARFLAAHRITAANATAETSSPTHAELTRRYPPRRQPSAMKRQASGSSGGRRRRLWAGEGAGDGSDAPEVAGVIVAVATPDRERALSQALRTFERSVNTRLGYPYAVFYPRSESFSEDFKNMVLRAASSSVVFGHLPLYASAPAATNAVLRLMGVQPLESPDVNAASNGYLAQRFFTATFFAHPLLQSYDYFIRLSPDADFLCDLYHDPLALLATHDKVYGFATTFTNTEEQARWAPRKKQPVAALARREDATAAPATEAPQPAAPGRLSVHSIAARYLVARAWKRGLGDGRHGSRGTGGQASAAATAAFDGKKFVRDLLETVAGGTPEQRLPAVIQAMDRFAAAAGTALRGSGEREAAPYAYAAAFFALVEDKGGDADGLLGEGAPFSSAFLSFVDPSVEDTSGGGGNNFTSSFYGDRNLRFCEFATGVEMGSLRFLRRANGYADFIAFLEETGQLTPEALRAHAFRSVGLALTAPLRALYLTEPLAFSQGGVLQFPADTSVCSHFPIPDRPAPDPQSDSLRCRALLSRLADPLV